MTGDLAAAKQAARLAARALRAGCDPAWGADLSRHLLASHRIAPGAAVGGFWPMAEEIDIRPLLRALHDQGHAVLLPETPARGAPLLFRRWHPGATLIRERFGTYRTDGPEAEPDLLLVPLLAFDRAGRRLGYGGGYYDRTLAHRPVPTIGCGYAAQELDEVPAGPYDARLDCIATERGVIEI
jgi:5-formyltetrahydrofolate cyclo-ligase